MPGIMARAIGRNIEDIYRESNKGVLSEVGVDVAGSWEQPVAST